MATKFRSKINFIFLIFLVFVIISYLIINDLRLSILIDLLFLFVVFVVTNYVVDYFYTKPIKKIVNEIDEINKGNFQRIIPETSDEVLNSLVNKINDLNQKIYEHTLEVEKLAKVRSQFLANVSHELRTPIFSVQAFIETLLDGALDDPKVNRLYLEKSKLQIERLNNLLNDLIEISRIESGEMKLSFRYFNINELLKNVCENYYHLAATKNIKIELYIDETKKIECYGDKERLAQVFNNLLDNAIKYNPENTFVKIYYEMNHNSIKLFVEDNGTGIPAEHLPRIFERFYRIDKQRSRELGGTGLGLAIVKHIIEAHNSKIEIQSEVGKGTKFWFTLKI